MAAQDKGALDGMRAERDDAVADAGCLARERDAARAAGWHEALDWLVGETGSLESQKLEHLRARYPRPVTTAAVVYDSTVEAP